MSDISLPTCCKRVAASSYQRWRFLFHSIEDKYDTRDGKPTCHCYHQYNKEYYQSRLVIFLAMIPHCRDCFGHHDTGLQRSRFALTHIWLTGTAIWESKSKQFDKPPAYHHSCCQATAFLFPGKYHSLVTSTSAPHDDTIKVSNYWWGMRDRLIYEGCSRLVTSTSTPHVAATKTFDYWWGQRDK